MGSTGKLVPKLFGQGKEKKETKVIAPTLGYARKVQELTEKVREQIEE
jgi:hypothetical protein